MPKDMFGDVVESSIKVGSQKWYTVPVSILIHLAVPDTARHKCEIPVFLMPEQRAQFGWPWPDGQSSWEPVLTPL